MKPSTTKLTHHTYTHRCHAGTGGARIAGELVPVIKLSVHLDGEIHIPLFTRRVPLPRKEKNKIKYPPIFTAKKEEREKKEKKGSKSTGKPPTAATLKP